ncbi:UbiD family decarboxylase [Chloroflexota bacterium]
MSKDLRQFLQILREAGHDFYVEVKKPLKPELELGIIHLKLASKGRFPAIYCPEIEGSKLPLVTDLFDSYGMFALALDMDPESDKLEILEEYIRRQNDSKTPKEVPSSEAPVKEVILRGRDIDLGLLPILKHAELNSGKYMTINPLICRDPVTGILNAGVYRHELKGKDELGALLVEDHHAATIRQHYAELGKPMEVVIFSGHHPAVIIGACQIGALDMNELEVIGGFLGEPLRVTPAETVDLPVPSDAEIVIEGVIDPNDWITDGPFSEYLGYYSGVRACNRVKVNCITMRKDAIYLDSDPAHREHPTLTLQAEAITFSALRSLVPYLKAVHYPTSGRRHHVYISINKSAQGEGKRAALAALGAMPWLTLAVVVDEDINIYSDEEVLWAISTRVRGDYDIDIIPGVSGGTGLEPTGLYDESRQESHMTATMTTKIMIDATKPIGDFPTRITPNKELWESMKLDDYLR